MSESEKKQACGRFSREVLELLSQTQRQGRAPSYRELADLQSQHHDVWLQALLQDWLEGGPLPTPAQLRQLCFMKDVVLPPPTVQSAPTTVG